MSSRRGDTRRTRPQKHQNTFAFKNDLHDKQTPLIKLITNLNVCEVCEHCKSVIDWKIKYRKYKPLTQPKSCSKCGERKVKRAYHVICRDCALANRCCAKCLKSADEAGSIIPPEPTEQEQVKLKAEMDQLIKSLPERKRRTFLRYMNRGQKKKRSAADQDGSDEDESEGRKKREKFVMPRTREELLEKFAQLKLAAGKHGEEGEEGDDDFSSDDEDYEDFSDEDLSISSGTK